jgi:phosphocarrier protein HPr
MIEREATIKNAHGIHCRPSTVIVKDSIGYDGTIEVTGKRGTASCQSVVELMALELFGGSGITIRVDGPDEKAQCDKLVELFETHFDFPLR